MKKRLLSLGSKVAREKVCRVRKPSEGGAGASQRCQRVFSKFRSHEPPALITWFLSRCTWTCVTQSIERTL